MKHKTTIIIEVNTGSEPYYPVTIMQNIAKAINAYQSKRNLTNQHEGTAIEQIFVAIPDTNYVTCAWDNGNCTDHNPFNHRIS